MRALLCVSLVAAIVFVVSEDSDSTMPTMNFDIHFNQLSERRHPFYKNGDPWREGRKYIQAVFRRYGCRDRRDHSFNTTITDQTVEGVNIICVVEGLNKTAPMIVVGADYATNKVGNQFKDNTGGVAALLEVMHIFFDRIYWNNYQLDRTVVFVAFDLNTIEYHDSGMGRPGSSYFVSDWLVPFLNDLGRNEKRELLGAIIMDSITIFNTAKDSQFLADGFEEAMPNAHKQIVESGNKGDFLGFLYPTKEINNPIVGSFPLIWNKDRKLRPFRLQEMQITLSYETLKYDIMKRIDHQAHYHFWTYLDSPMPAVLLFDTDNDRTDPAPCRVEVNCTVEEFLTKNKTAFLTKITDTVTNTLLELQTTYYSDKSDGPCHSPLAITTLLLLVLSSLMCLLC